MIGPVDPPLAAELLGVADGLVPEVRVIARDEIADAQLREDLVEALGADEMAALVARGRRYDVRALYATLDRALDADPRRARRPARDPAILIATKKQFIHVHSRCEHE